MDQPNQDALDEIVWRAPEIVQELQGIHTNTVLFYFARSPFFDETSNNNVIFTQAMNNQAMYPYVTTRALFEERLRSMPGLEFVVAQDPSEGDTKQTHSGVWVIKKQRRRKRAGMTDEITPISAYFVMGENVYMAPSLMSVLSSRLLSTLTNLSSFLSTIKPLPDFTPALGHTYLPPTSKHTTPASSFQATQTSKESTPLPGSTPRPDLQPPSQKPSADTDYQSQRLFAEAWDLTLRYGNDYMDENPIIGEPGNFKLSATKPLSLSTSMSSTMTAPQPFRAVNKAPPIRTDLSEKEKQGSVSSATGGSAGAGGGSAKTPVTAGFKDKKGRRKSKAAGVATPKAETPKTVTPT